ncbi:MAG: hypothetical protein HC819_10050 [Cyclobacteriaceae bacterium]|nr:hypothetical protein [Cyclobacteriaceae bacterium]
MNSKPRVVKDYEKLDSDIQEQIKLVYPYGFSDSLVSYTDKDGMRRTALPFETDDKYYLIRMTLSEAMQIIDEDDDFDSSGELKDEIKEEYEEKYSDIEYLNTEEGEDEEKSKYADSYDESDEADDDEDEAEDDDF